MDRQFNICALSVEEISRQFQTVRSGLAAARVDHVKLRHGQFDGFGRKDVQSVLHDMVLPDLRQIDEHADQDVHTPGGLRLDQDQVSAVYVHAQIIADAVGDLPDDGEIGDVCLCGFRILRVEDMEKLQKRIEGKFALPDNPVNKNRQKQ